MYLYCHCFISWCLIFIFIRSSLASDLVLVPGQGRKRPGMASDLVLVPGQDRIPLVCPLHSALYFAQQYQAFVLVLFRFLVSSFEYVYFNFISLVLLRKSYVIFLFQFCSEYLLFCFPVPCFLLFQVIGLIHLINFSFVLSCCSPLFSTTLFCLQFLFHASQFCVSVSILHFCSLFWFCLRGFGMCFVSNSLFVVFLFSV